MCSGPRVDNSAQAQAQREAEEARAAEAARQARIALGREQVNRAFDQGQTLRAGAGTLENPAWAEWNTRRQAGGTEVTTPGPSDGDGGPTTTSFFMPFNEPEPARFRERTDADWETTGTAFNDEWFDGRRQSVLDYYTTDLSRQFGDARDQMAISLARAGLTKSTEAGRQMGRVNEQFQVAAGDVARRAEGAAADARRDVENQRSTLLTQLEATGDASGAANAALARSQVLRQTPVSYDPLGDIFAGVSGVVGAGIQGYRDANLMRTVRDAATPRSPSSGGSAHVVRN